MGVQVPPVDQHVPRRLVRDGRQQPQHRHRRPDAPPHLALRVRLQPPAGEVRAAAEESQPQVLRARPLPERRPQDGVHALPAEEAQHGEREVGEQVPRRAERPRQRLHPGERVRGARVPRVQRRHQRALARAPDAIDRNARVLKGAERAEVRQPVPAAAGEHHPDAAPRDATRQTLDVLARTEAEAVVAKKVGARVAPRAKP